MPPGSAPDTAQAQKTPSSGLASLYDWVEMAAASLICVVLVFAFVFRIMGVDGSSMIQTLHHRDRVILWELFYTPKARGYCGDQPGQSGTDHQAGDRHAGGYDFV